MASHHPPTIMHFKSASRMHSFYFSSSHSSSEITNQSIDISNRAVDLACRLGTLTHFIGAAEELLAYGNLPHIFSRHSRKIIALIETAHRTLNRANIRVYTFSYCHTAFVAYKAAYLALLKMLQSNQQHVDDSLQERIQRLLLPLRTKFRIERKGDLTPPQQHATNDFIQRGQGSQGTTFSQLHPSSHLPITTYMMPPPPGVCNKSQFSNAVLSSPSLRKNHRLWDLEQIKKRPHQHRSSSRAIITTTEDQENVVPSYRLLRPLSRRFGIFCTAKTSMHRPRERIGPSAGRSLIKE